MKVLPVINHTKPRVNFKNNVVKGATKTVDGVLPVITKALPTVGGTAILCLLGITNPKLNTNEDEFKIRDISDEEFKAKRAEIMAKKDEFEPFRYLEEEDFTKWNVQLFEYMYEDCKGLTSDFPTHKDLEKEKNLALYKGYMRLQCDHQYRVPVENKYQAEVVLKMMKMPWLFASDGKGNYAHALNNAGYNIEGKKSAEIRNMKLKILDELEKNNEKYKNPTYNQINNICEMIADVTTGRGLNIALKMIRHPELLEADQCDLRIDEFFKRISENKEQAKIASEITDKILQNPELFKKEDFNHALTHMLKYAHNVYEKNLVLKFLDNPELFNYDDFVGNMPGIICDFPSSESAEDIEIRQDVFNTLDYYKKNPELLKNQKPYEYHDFVYALISHCEIPNLDCPMWPIPDRVLDAIRENPELLEDDDW